MTGLFFTGLAYAGTTLNRADSNAPTMSQEQTVTLSDMGKAVVVGDDEVVGEIAEVDERDNGANRIYVETDPDASGSVLSRLGWDETGSDHQRLDPERIEAVYENQVRISSM